MLTRAETIIAKYSKRRKDLSLKRDIMAELVLLSPEDQLELLVLVALADGATSIFFEIREKQLQEGSA